MKPQGKAPVGKEAVTREDRRRDEGAKFREAKKGQGREDKRQK